MDISEETITITVAPNKSDSISTWMEIPTDLLKPKLLAAIDLAVSKGYFFEST